MLDPGRLYPITERHNAGGLSHLELVRLFLSGGARFIQVREKQWTDRQWFEELVAILAVCREAKARLIVNDRAELARAVKADGVHLGQEDLPVDVAREMLGLDAIIGVSTHDENQFERARKTGVNYIAIGPIFSSRTKPRAEQPLGCDLLRKVARNLDRPLVAIGGIDLESAPRVWATGAHSVAVISDVVNAPDPEWRVRQYLRLAEEVDS
jgi:thiamine-phosphate pyrophosphorylase